MKHFFFVWCIIPLLKTGTLASTRDLLHQVDDEKLIENWHMHVWWLLLATVLAWWWHLVASNKALNLLYWAMRAVLYRRTAAAIKMASKVGVFVDCCLFAYCPGGCRGNTEQVVAQWWHPVASQVAQDMPHWAMPSVLLQRTAMAIKMANNGATFWCHRQIRHQQLP